MNTDTIASTAEASEKQRNKAAQKFFTAQASLIVATEAMVDTVYAVTQDPARQTSLDTLLGQIAAKQVELATLLDSFLSPRHPNAAAYDLKFVRAGHEAENRLCNHSHYDFKKHGRFCTCGTVMCDFGD